MGVVVFLREVETRVATLPSFLPSVPDPAELVPVDVVRLPFRTPACVDDPVPPIWKF